MGSKRLSAAGNRLAISLGAEVTRIEITKRREAPEWSQATEDLFHSLACEEQARLAERRLESPHYAGSRVVLVSLLAPRLEQVLTRLARLELLP